MTKPYQSATALTALVLFNGVATEARAEPICVDLVAEIAYIDDIGGVLPSSIAVGGLVTGTYVYESTTPDINPSPALGLYMYTSAPFGITLDVGGYVFRTDPDNVEFGIEIADDFGDPPSDTYLVGSTNNLFDLGSGGRNFITWQLDDPTATALSSDALPAAPPDLGDWQSIFGLDIVNDAFIPEQSFLIRSHVTSASSIPCENPPSHKVPICHKPGTSAQRTLFVAQQAVSGHVGHGDVLGACP